MYNRIAIFACGVCLLFAIGSDVQADQVGLGNFGCLDSNRRPAEFTSLGAMIQTCDRIEVWRILPAVEELPCARFETIEVLKWGAPPGLTYPMEASPYKMAQPDLKWDQPGRAVVAFIQGRQAFVCHGPYWQRIVDSQNELEASFGRRAAEDLSELFHGSTATLIDRTRRILAGEEVIVSAVKFAESYSSYQELRIPSARIWRLKASLKITTTSQTQRSPNFVGWGAADKSEISNLARRLSHADPCERWLAMRTLHSMGEQATTAIPDLEQSLADPDPNLRMFTAQVLRRIQPDHPLAAVAMLFELRNRDMEVRELAASILENEGQATLDALPAITMACEREPWPYSPKMATLLGRAASSAPPEMRLELVALVARKLRSSTDDDRHFRRSAVHSLDELGPDIGPAISTLKSLVRRCPNSSVGAAGVLARLTPDGAAWLAEMLDKPHHGNLHGSIPLAGDNAHAAVPTLFKHLHGKDPWPRLFAASALLRIDRDQFAPEVRQVAEEFLENGNSMMFRFACELRSRSRPAVRNEPSEQPDRTYTRKQRRFRLLDQIQRESDVNDRRQMIMALGNQGPEARDVAPDLWRLMKEDQTETRATLALAIWKIEGVVEAGDFRRDCRPALLAELRAMLRNKEKVHLQEEALLAVLSLKRAALPLTADIIRCLDQYPLQSPAVAALRELGPAAKEAIPNLLKIVELDHRGLQESTIVALCRISQGGPESMQLLNEWCKYEDDGILFELQPGDIKGQVAIGLLLKSLKSANWATVERLMPLLRSSDAEAAKKVVLPKRLTVRFYEFDDDDRYVPSPY